MDSCWPYRCQKPKECTICRIIILNESISSPAELDYLLWGIRSKGRFLFCWIIRFITRCSISSVLWCLRGADELRKGRCGMCCGCPRFWKCAALIKSSDGCRPADIPFPPICFSSQLINHLYSVIFQPGHVYNGSNEIKQEHISLNRAINLIDSDLSFLQFTLHVSALHISL